MVGRFANVTLVSDDDKVGRKVMMKVGMNVGREIRLVDGIFR